MTDSYTINKETLQCSPEHSTFIPNEVMDKLVSLKLRHKPHSIAALFVIHSVDQENISEELIRLEQIKKYTHKNDHKNLPNALKELEELGYIKKEADGYRVTPSYRQAKLDAIKEYDKINCNL